MQKENSFSKDKRYYSIMGVFRDSTQEDIKKAFKLLAKKYNPDKGIQKPNEKMQELNEANEVLSDPDTRKEYDEVSTLQQNFTLINIFIV